MLLILQGNTVIIIGHLAAVSCNIIKVFAEQMNVKLHYCYVIALIHIF
jgi:hypothetical protein